jgi:hypothetical protein
VIAEPHAGHVRLSVAVWAVAVGAAWYAWLAIAQIPARLLMGAFARTGQHADSDLIVFALVYAGAALYLMLVGWAGHRLIELLRPPLAVWKPGALVVAATALAQIAYRQEVLGLTPRSALIGAIVLPFVLAPAAVLAGIGLAAAQRRRRG